MLARGYNTASCTRVSRGVVIWMALNKSKPPPAKQATHPQREARVQDKKGLRNSRTSKACTEARTGAGSEASALICRHSPCVSGHELHDLFEDLLLGVQDGIGEGCHVIKALRTNSLSDTRACSHAPGARRWRK